MFESLKSATLPEHTKLEKELVLRLKSISSVNDYLKILSSLYGFYYPLENEIQSRVPEDLLPDVRERKRSHLLISDIQLLDQTALGNLKVASPPALRSASEALGALYVLEGSTLGGQVITQMLNRNSNLPVKEATRYFSGYGERTHQMWAEFKQRVVANKSSINETEMISSASNTFKGLHSWLTMN